MADVTKELQEKFDQYTKQVSEGLNQGLRTVSTTLSSSATFAHEEASKLLEKSKELTDTVASEAKQVEGVVIGHLRDGVKIIAENQNVSMAVAGTVTVLAIPATRRLLYHVIVGRFRSEEGVYKSANLQLKQLAQSFEQQKLDARKLEERLQLAEQEYSRGLSKLQSVGQQLLSLQKQLRKSHVTTQLTLGDLRRLPSKSAIQLRSEAAEVASRIKEQQNAVDRHVQQLLKKGML